jgi:hypothetical protein
VLDAYLDGTLVETLQQRADKLRDADADMDADESMVLGFLQQRLVVSQ